MPLLFAVIGQEVSVKKVGGSPEVRQHLTELGFTQGAKITVVQKIDSGLIVKVRESRVALDTSMASKIIV